VKTGQWTLHNKEQKYIETTFNVVLQKATKNFLEQTQNKRVDVTKYLHVEKELLGKINPQKLHKSEDTRVTPSQSLIVC